MFASPFMPFIISSFQRVRAKIELPDGSFDARYYDLSDIKVSKEPAKKAPKNTKSEVNNKQENKDNNSK